MSDICGVYCQHTITEYPMPRAKSPDPKRNAGISLTGKQLENLGDYQRRAKLDSRSAVIELLIERYMPALWHDLLLQESKQK